MFRKASVLLAVSFAPCFSWAAFTGEYVTPDENTKMEIQARAQNFNVVVHKHVQNHNCDVQFPLFRADDNPDKLVAKVGGCWVTVLTNNEWASITGNGECEDLCEEGSIDTQGLKHR